MSAAADKPTLTEPERERSGQTQVKGRASRLSSGSVSAAADRPEDNQRGLVPPKGAS